MTRWLIVGVALWAWFALCAHWEPIVFDSWGHYFWHHEYAMTLGNVGDFIATEYNHWNPRIGELAALLSFTPGPWHVLFTPLMELAAFYVLCVAVAGRRPDLLTFALTLALVLVCAREVGTVLFYRPFAWNFVLALLLAAVFVVPYRIAGADERWWWAPGMVLLGLVAGLGAEHTGLALVGIAIAAMVQRRAARPWMVAGALACAAGWALLFFAPSQRVKYGGLAAKQSTLDLLASRGVAGNLRVVWLPLVNMWPGLLVAVIAVALGRRRLARPFVVALVAAAASLVMLLASPKQGPRLWFAPLATICAVAAVCLREQLVHARARIIAGVVTAAVLAVCAWQSLRVYRVLGREGSERMAILEHATPGTVVTVPRLSPGRTHWSLRDDLEEPARRQSVAMGFHLAGLELTK